MKNPILVIGPYLLLCVNAVYSLQLSWYSHEPIFTRPHDEQ